ncbi:hypothetical protein OG530_00820 [Streptomyces decoyicus]|uniref:hypothetical protein n=1 Tax=Streptomyces decoyicus TaxID=249567 RepID=UPI002E18854B
MRERPYCQRPGHASGPIATEAAPISSAHGYGPGMPDDGTLPHGLRAAPAPRHAAHLN